MAVVPMKALLESGVHFGHRTHKWHPGMKPYIFTERNGIHIIDLQKTVKSLEQAYNLVRDSVAEGNTVLFVGTKRQAQETIQLEAQRAGMPYVTIRWLGGMLTNWRTIRARINELERLERMRDRGEFERLTKKEGLILSREIERLEMLLGGIRQMARLTRPAVRRRCPPGSHSHPRGQPAEYPGRRFGGHELRSGERRLRHPFE